MNDVPEKEKLRMHIIHLREVMKLSFRQITGRLGISRKSASTIYYKNYGDRPPRRTQYLDRFSSLLTNWFREYPNLKAIQAYDWLAERGATISYSQVARYTKELRTKKERSYHMLTFSPGEEAQVDWAIVNHPECGRLYCFVFVLSFSRYCFAEVFNRSSFEFFIEGHLHAFKALDGLPYALRYDNLKSVVLKRKPEISYNPRFLEFCNHYKIEPRLCNPCAGNEKGRVERTIRTLRDTFFNTMASCTSVDSLNKELYQWVDEKNKKIHRVTGRRPIDLLGEEHLKRLPVLAWNNVSIHTPVKTTKTALMIFDTNTYSVPDYLVGKPLSIHSTPRHVDIYDAKDKKIASHPRCFERNKAIINPLHKSFSRISQRSKMDRIYNLINNMHPQLSAFLGKNQAMDEDPKVMAYEIFKSLHKHSRSMIISIITECLRIKSPRLKTFVSYLHKDKQDTLEEVNPQNRAILNLSYTPRSLEEYDEHK